MYMRILTASSIEKCKAGDSECLRSTIEHFIQTNPSGLPEIGLAPLDPLAFTDVVVSQDAKSPVSINLTMPTGSIRGWRNMVVKKVV